MILARIGTALTLLALFAPVVIGTVLFLIVILSGRYWPKDIWLAILCGFASTLLFMLLHFVALGEERYRSTARSISIVTDVIIWSLISFVMMGIGFKFLNAAVHGYGIYWLDTDKVYDFSLMEFLAMGFFFIICVLRFAFPRRHHPLPGKIGEFRDELGKIRYSAYGFAAGATIFVALGWFGFCLLDRVRSKVFLGGEGCGSRPLPAPPPAVDPDKLIPSQLLTERWVLAAGASIAVIVILYFWPALRDRVVRRVFGEDTPGSELLAMLFLALIILPPLIVGMVLSSSVDHESLRLGWGTTVIFGLFLYAGFLVWTLSINLAEKLKFPRASVALALLFVYAAAVTVAWVVIIEFLRWTSRATRGNFESMLKTAVAAVLIVLVFSYLYRRVLGRSLSDQWPGERAMYIIFSLIAGGLIVGTPNDWAYKPIAVVATILLLLVGPALVLRRRLAAFVLIGAEPGRTEHVQEELEMEEVNVASLFGSVDLLARVEVERRSGTEDVLAALSGKVRDRIRSKKGVTSTETLIDISHLMAYWSRSRGRRRT